MKKKGLLSSRMVDAENPNPQPHSKIDKVPTFYSGDTPPKTKLNGSEMEPDTVPKKEKKVKDRKAKYYIEDPADRPVQRTEKDPDKRGITTFSEASTIDDAAKSVRRQRFVRRFVSALRILVILLSAYLCFLIYGLANTDFIYNDDGKVVPEILTVSDIKKLKEYEQIQAFYLRARIIYEDILRLDYKLSVNPDAELSIAMDYTKELEVVDKFLTDIKGAEYDSGYYKLYENMTNWAKTDVALYLQYMSEALTSNNEEAASNALTCRNIVYDDFASISKNTASLAVDTKGAENIDIFEWSPESYVESLKGE